MTDNAKKRRHLPADSFPGRYLETRPWAEAMYERSRKRFVAKADRDDEAFESETLDPMSEFERKVFLAEARRRNRAVIRPDLVNRLNEEALAHAFCAWVMEGRHMFVVDAALTRLLAQTGIEGMPLSAICTPYHMCYLGFERAGLAILGSKFIGAIVDHRRGFLSVMLILERPYHSGHTDLDEALSIPARELGVEITMRVRPDESDDVSVLRLADEWIDSWVPGLVLKKALFIQDQRSRLGLPLDPESAVNQPNFNALLHDRPACLAALQLVVNALFYITAYRDQVKPTWPDAPTAWLAPLTDPSLSAKARYRARTKLQQEGYSEVWICGADEIFPPEADPSAPSGATVASHWRRGHWRQQAIGVGRADRRLTWIRPVLVKAGDTEPKARVYHVTDKRGAL